ncbi:DUF7619 domain-containing protein [Flavobacterium sp. SM2513]|uniref:DUF7619 domain-containing protein n=1 Tax=Flavobacterium sp. SM2513 TaxID=3424766 RepID=UPI003D7FE46D
MKKQLLYAVLVLFSAVLSGNAHTINDGNPKNTLGNSSVNERSTRTLLSPENFITKVVNDDCEAVITAQPVGITICSNASATFTVAATDSGLTNQWFGPTGLIASATNASYTIANATPASAGNYVEIVTGSCGTPVTSNSDNLIIPQEIIFILQPYASTSVCVGDPVFLSIAVIGASNFSYQWYKGSTVIPGATSTTYGINSTNVADSGNYTCKVTSSGNTVTSNVAVVIVNDLPWATIAASATTVCLGEPTYLYITGTPNATVTYSDGTNNYAVTLNNEGVITIAMPILFTTTTFTLVSAENSLTGCYKALTGSVTIIVDENTTIIEQPQGATVCAGQTISLSVTATGSNLIYQWYKGSSVIAGGTEPTFVMFSTTVADSGDYTCVVYSSCGTPITSSEAVVVVNNGANGSPCGDTIQLIVFVDANSNGVKEATEAGFGYGAFTYQKNNAGTIYYANSPLGFHTIYDENTTTTYDFDYEINSEYAAYYGETPTNFNDLTIPLGSGVQTLYFPITLTQTYNDVEVSLIALAVPRPGFPYTHQIVYKNVGHNPSSGTITYTKSNANIAITSTTPSETTTTSDGFTYNYTNLLPGQTATILVNMQVGTIPTVNLGDIVPNTVSIAPIESDVNLTNNSFTIVQTVVGSYDPNDKTEARGESVQIGQFAQGDYLYYTIRFQNTGTASAETVRIEDNLTSDFDFASVRMISASHDYTMERINNKLVWTSNTINLPSENANEPGSHGYVLFKIKLNTGFAVGDVIENTAEIYFDFNPAIITNTFQTTFVPNLSTGSFEASNLVVYPNPAREVVQITLQNATETMSKVVIYDIIGKAIKIISGDNAQQATVNVSDLSKGVYMIEITTDSNLKQIRKFIVN